MGSLVLGMFLAIFILLLIVGAALFVFMIGLISHDNSRKIQQHNS